MRDAEAKRITDEAYAAAMKAKAEALAAKKAAAAPDKTRLLDFAGRLAALDIPAMKSIEADELRDDIISRVNQLAKWIQTRVADL